VHVDEVELVVHVDPPAEHKAYLHRSGRTARAGSAGDVVTVVLPEQRKDAQQLLRKAGITARPQEVVADSAPVQALVGEIAPYRAPAPKEAPAPRGGNRPAKTATAGQAQRRRRSSGGLQAPGRAQSQSGRTQSGRSQSGRSQSGRSQSR
ncbi:MAG: DEAD/DEAH box helicase, partial [Mycobacterium sp.]